MKKIQRLNYAPVRADGEKKSPFAVYEGETLYRFVETQPHWHRLTDLDILLVKAVARHVVISSYMLSEMLRGSGVECENADVRMRLRSLARAGYIQKAEFRTASGHSTAKLYMLSTRGRSLLFNMGVPVGSSNVLVSLDALGAKRLLAVNQYAILTGAYEVELKPLVFTVPKRACERPTEQLRPHGMISAGGQTVFLEAVRQGENAVEELLGKLDRMERVVRSKRTNVPLSQDVKVVLIAESYNAMLDTMKATHKRYPSLSFLYTHDLEIYTSPEDCLYEYDPEPEGFLRRIRAACL